MGSKSGVGWGGGDFGDHSLTGKRADDFGSLDTNL